MRTKAGGVVAVLVAVGLAGCLSNRSGQPGQASRLGGKAEAPDVRAGVGRVAEDEVRALLLVLEDRKIYDVTAVDQALRGGVGLREELAVTLGRAGDRQGRRVLEGLLIDEAVEVRRAAAFGLGLLGDGEARAALLRAVVDPDRETGKLAIEALGRLKVPVVEVARLLPGLAEEERWPRLLPALFRFHEEAMVPLAEHGLELPRRELRIWAAYALCREPFPVALPLLRALLGDAEPEVRAWAARAIGLVGGGDDLERLLPLLDDRAAGPVVQALRAARSLVAGGKAQAAAGWQGRLRALLADGRGGVRLAALEAAGVWLPDAELAGDLAAHAAHDAAGDEGGRERGTALLALAAAGDPRAAELVLAAAGAPQPDLRAHAAEAAGKLAGPWRDEVLARLGRDPSPLVREAVLGVQLPAGGGSAPAGAVGRPAPVPPPADPAKPADPADPSHPSNIARRVLAADTSQGVLATVFTWLAEHPVLALSEMAPALPRVLQEGTVEAGMAAVKALRARAAARPAEHGQLVAVLAKIAEGDSDVLRREAGSALAQLGEAAPPRRPAAAERPLDFYREVVARTRRPRTVEVTTRRGAFRLRVACPEAPLTCLNFLSLAAQGFYDGLTFHRVVADFVVQGGDPEGDGFGGPGYTLRNEVNRLRYDRGVCGIALAGPDTGGSQFFVTLSPQPHLDGIYTAFAVVTAGGEVLDQLAVGDRIERMREVP